MTDPIQVTGLKQFVKSVKALDGEMPKAIRLANNEAANIVVTGARPKVPSRSGRARKSMRAKSTRTAVRVSAGSKRDPYFAWLDFGGKTGINRSVDRPFFKSGRYIYPTYSSSKDEIVQVMTDGYLDVARQAGLEVSP